MLFGLITISFYFSTRPSYCIFMRFMWMYRDIMYRVSAFKARYVLQLGICRTR